MPGELLQLIDLHHLAAARDAGVARRVEVAEAVIRLVLDADGGEIDAEHRGCIVVPPARPQPLAGGLHSKPRLKCVVQVTRDRHDILASVLADGRLDADGETLFAADEALGPKACAFAGAKRNREGDAVKHRPVYSGQPGDGRGLLDVRDQSRDLVACHHATFAADVDLAVKQFEPLEGVRLI